MAELRVKGTGTLKLFENDNTSSVTIASPASLGGDRTVTLPDGDVTLVAGTMSTGLTGWSTDSGTNDSLVPDSASAGIYLGVAAATAANLLDDYEEGTWTPGLLAFSGSAESFIDPRYTKIGRLVFISFQLQIGTFPSDGSVFTITGLPFTVLDGAGTTFGAVPFRSTGSSMFGLTAGGNNTNLEMYSLTDGSGGQFNYNDYGQSENMGVNFFYEAD